MNITRKHRVALGVLGVVVGAGVAWASTFDWETYISPSSAHDLIVQHSMSMTGSDGPATDIRARRGPINPTTKDFTLTAKVTIDALGVLNAMQLQVAHDSNHNGIVEELEWQTVATGVITISGNQTIAETGTVTRNLLTDDGWRVRMERSDIGVNTEEVIDEELDWDF